MEKKELIEIDKEELKKHGGHKPYLRYYYPGSTWNPLQKIDLFCPKCKKVLLVIQY